jgi:hypothetical protein
LRGVAAGPRSFGPGAAPLLDADSLTLVVSAADRARIPGLLAPKPPPSGADAAIETFGGVPADDEGRQRLPNRGGGAVARETELSPAPAPSD